jgi:hypothetical protein
MCAELADSEVSLWLGRSGTLLRVTAPRAPTRRRPLIASAPCASREAGADVVVRTHGSANCVGPRHVSFVQSEAGPTIVFNPQRRIDGSQR